MHSKPNPIKKLLQNFVFAGALVITILTGCKGDGGGSSGPVLQDYIVQTLDQDGNPIQNAGISLYSSELYNTDDGSGEYEALQPKTIPDATTNANGEALLKLWSDQSYHIVAAAPGFDSESEFNRKYLSPTQPKPSLQKPDSNLQMFLPSSSGSGGFNAEGHIKYQENYNQNKYCVGDKIKFMMFGVNNTSLDQVISFFVLDHTQTGNPNTAPIIYTGDFNNPAESLIIPAGQKVHKVFEWVIPSSLAPKWGKYAIHVRWSGYQNGAKPWHKIGNWFLIEDTTPLSFWAGFQNPFFFTNEQVEIWYSITDPAQPGTVRAQQVDISSLGPTQPVYCDIDIETDSNGDGNPANDINYTFTSSPGIANPYGEVVVTGDYFETGKNAKPYTVKLWAYDPSGNLTERTLAVRIDLTKAEADALADMIYDNGFGWPGYGAGYFGTWSPLGPNGAPFDYFTDYLVSTSGTATSFDVLCNKWNESYRIGHNYNKQGGGPEGNPNEPGSQVAQLLSVIYNIIYINADWILPFYVQNPDGTYRYRGTKEEFTQALIDFLQYSKNQGKIP